MAGSFLKRLSAQGLQRPLEVLLIAVVQPSSMQIRGAGVRALTGDVRRDKARNVR